jgi:hypothetical protein
MTKYCLKLRGLHKRQREVRNPSHRVLASTAMLNHKMLREIAWAA